MGRANLWVFMVNCPHWKTLRGFFPLLALMNHYFFFLIFIFLNFIIFLIVFFSSFFLISVLFCFFIFFNFLIFLKYFNFFNFYFLFFLYIFFMNHWWIKKCTEKTGRVTFFLVKWTYLKNFIALFYFLILFLIRILTNVVKVSKRAEYPSYINPSLEWK